MALTVDKEKCISCMTCVSLCPNNFRIGEDGKAEVFSKDGITPEDAKKVIDSCPVGAISSSQ